jgi:1,4-alpha-glucan branching enzyme
MALNSDDPEFGGTGVAVPDVIHSEKEPFNGMDHSAKVTLPPLSCIYYTFTSK